MFGLREIKTKPVTAKNVAAGDKNWYRRWRTQLTVKWFQGFRHVWWGAVAKCLTKLGYGKKEFVKSFPVSNAKNFPEGDREQVQLLLEAGEAARKATKRRTVKYLNGAAVVEETLEDWLYYWLMRGWRVNLSGKKFRRPKLAYWPVAYEPVRQQYPLGWAYDPSDPEKYSEDEMLMDPSIREDLKESKT